LVARKLTFLCVVSSVIRRAAKPSRCTTDFDDATAINFSMHPLFSGCTNFPRLEKDKGEKCTAGVLAASVAT
jgi:hypothetical protein